MRNYRQGDVYLFSINKLPEGVKPRESTVVALGEVTGHRHELSNVDVFVADDGQLYGVAKEGARLDHLDTQNVQTKEHAPHDINEGTYKITIQEQYTPEGWRQVAD